MSMHERSECGELCFCHFEEDDERGHSFDCICETCLQNHPERDILYGDGTYYGDQESED